jgi:hypothetical protein
LNTIGSKTTRLFPHCEKQLRQECNIFKKGHGIFFADLDHDGDQDLSAEMGGGNPGDAFNNVLFANPGFGNRFLVIKLVGTRSNQCAMGARVRVDIKEDGASRAIYKWVNGGGSFGANPLRQHIRTR